MNYVVGSNGRDSHCIDGKLDLLAEVHCWEGGKPTDSGEEVGEAQKKVQGEGKQGGRAGDWMQGNDDWKTGVTPGGFSSSSPTNHTYFAKRGGRG